MKQRNTVRKPEPQNLLARVMLAASIALLLNVFVIVSESGSPFWERIHKTVVALTGHS